jgi:hypothetical protein
LARSEPSPDAVLALQLRRGLTYRELLASLLMAGVRNIEPRPVGFKFHVVLVINLL